MQNWDRILTHGSISMTIVTEPQFQPENKATLFADPPDSVTNPHLFEFESLGVSKAHAHIIREVKFMTYQVVLHWPSNAISNHCSDVLIRLLSLAPPVEEGQLVVSISESCRLGVAILCFLPFKYDYPSPAQMVNVQLQKMKANLESMIEFTAHTHPLLPWILSVGAVHAQPQDRSWYIDHLLEVVKEHHIHTWEEMKPHLVKVLWVEVFCEAPFRELWDEVSAERDGVNKGIYV